MTASRPEHLDELRSHIYRQFESPDLHVHIRRITQDKHTREVQKMRPRVVDSNPRLLETSQYYSLRPVAGSVMMYCARKGSAFLQTLAQSYERGDQDQLRKLSDQVDKDVAQREVITV